MTPIDTWDEFRTAYHVARLGTVSAAAEALGVHHATVIRHVDALEGRLGVKLFQRHSRGYTATEAGADLLRVGRETEERLAGLVGRLRGGGSEMTGELVVTSLSSLSPLLTPALARFRETHPGLTVRYLTDQRVFRLEIGEAHVAVRAGAPPDHPDNVVQPFATHDFALFGSDSYIARHGRPDGEADLAEHLFVGLDAPVSRVPSEQWLRANVPPDRVVFRVSHEPDIREAVEAGAGLGFLMQWEVEGAEGLTEVLPPRPEWASRLWLVTHVDLHRTAKVRTFLSFLKETARGWRDEVRR